MQQDARPARSEQHGHLAGGCGDRVEIDDGLRQRLVDRPVPGFGSYQLVIEIAAAEPEGPRLAPAVLFDHDRDVETDERAYVGGDETVGADDLDDVPAARQRDRNLRDARVARTSGGVDRLAQIHLVGEGNEIERVGCRIEVAVGGARRAGLGRARRIDQRHRFARAADRGGAELVGVREGGHLARHGAQAKARMRVVARCLQPTIVEAERLGLAILQI